RRPPSAAHPPPPDPPGHPASSRRQATRRARRRSRDLPRTSSPGRFPARGLGYPPRVIEDLAPLGDLPDVLVRRAQAADVYLVWRAQARTAQRVLVRERRVEETSASSLSGLGLQAVTAD